MISSKSFFLSVNIDSVNLFFLAFFDLCCSIISGITEYIDGITTITAESTPTHILLYALNPTMVAIIARTPNDIYKHFVLFMVFFLPFSPK